MSSSQENLKDFCRICLKNNKLVVDLSTNSIEGEKILQDIYLCFRIVLTFQSNLPHNICCDCLKEVITAKNLRLKFLSYEEKLAKLLKQIKRPLYERKDKFDNKTFAGLQNKNKQEDQVTSKNKIPDGFNCNICGKVLKTVASLQNHKVTMHQRRKYLGTVSGSGVSRRYQCTSCPYSTPHSQTLVNHIRRHDGKRPYSCHCGKNFTQASGLSAHLKTHSEATFFTCTKCGKQFKHAYILKRHLSVHENGSFSCDICKKVLKTKQSLHEHIHRHYDVRNFNCEECGKTFVTSSELIQHKKKHKLHKKLECHLCGYKTHSRKSLILHLKRHAGEKAFKCDLCDMKFFTQCEAQRHQRVHTREKPFLCPMCTQRFAYSPSLNKHLLLIHNVQYKWGDIKKKNLKKLF